MNVPRKMHGKHLVRVGLEQLVFHVIKKKKKLQKLVIGGPEAFLYNYAPLKTSHYTGHATFNFAFTIS